MGMERQEGSTAEQQLIFGPRGCWRPCVQDILFESIGWCRWAFQCQTCTGKCRHLSLTAFSVHFASRVHICCMQVTTGLLSAVLALEGLMKAAPPRAGLPVRRIMRAPSPHDASLGECSLPHACASSDCPTAECLRQQFRPLSTPDAAAPVSEYVAETWASANSLICRQIMVQH